MKWMRCWFVVALFSVLFIAGCGLTREQQQRIEVLAAENEALVAKQQELVKKIQLGTATPEEVALAFQGIAAQMKKNADEIKAIKESGSTTAWITAGLALFGRTALHAVGAMIPGGTPAAVLIQGFLTVLLGGSQTAKKDPAPAT